MKKLAVREQERDALNCKYEDNFMLLSSLRGINGVAQKFSHEKLQKKQ